ncbi:uncharacterized protein TNCV_1797331 [Trichonephila clavipes]|nr:uncharacterized protein TNCV_1797331 [Trichonephila clavipes]
MKASRLTLDFNKKSLVIPDDQIKPLPIVENPVVIDLSNTKLDKLGLTHALYHEINTGDQGPVVSRPYRYDRVKQGTIRPSQSPYASPVVLTSKNNGLPPDSQEAYRFAIHYRKLNAITKHSRCPLPLIDDLITNIPFTTIMSTLHLKSGYFQLAINPRGLIISKDGINTDDNKVEAIKDMKPPKNNKEVSKYLGIVGWYLKFIRKNPVDNLEGSQILCAALRDLALNYREQLLQEQLEDPELKHTYRYLENPDDSSVNATVCEDPEVLPGPSNQGQMRRFSTPKEESSRKARVESDKARETRTKDSGRHSATEGKLVQSRKKTTVRPIPYYLRSRFKERE